MEDPSHHTSPPHHSPRVTIRTWVTAAVVVLALVGVTAALSVHMATRWSGESYAGKISEVAEHSFTIEGNMGQHRTVMFSDNTLIKRGGETLPQSALVAGTYVIVVGPPRGPDTTDAVLIRIISQSSMRPTW